MADTKKPKVELRRDRVGFRPRARLLLLLGDQLIRDPGIAVFELVKNAFDADSPEAIVTMSRVTEPDLGRIVVEDPGTGMDFDTVTKVWLEPGTDYRLLQRTQGQKTAKFHRTPIGEKGVGRFAAHKLGHRVRMITRRGQRPEVLVDINWKADFETKTYLDEVRLTVRERKPEHFRGNRTGTLIEVSDLRNAWTRAMVRDLARSINSICSPFDKGGEFKANLVLKDHQDWLVGILDTAEVLSYSLFHAQCLLRSNTLSYTYRFTPYPGMDRVKPRRIVRKVPLKSRTEQIDLDAHNIGPVQMDLYIFDQDPRVLALAQLSDRQGLKDLLNESGGIRVYRGGIRVYDYGERGNDWLGLGGRRVNIPSKRLSNNLILGAVNLDPEKSQNLDKQRGLIEKTNREGFVENRDFEAFRDAVAVALQHIETERNIDKTAIRNAYSPKKLREPVIDDISELRQLVEVRGLTKDIGPYLDRIENDFLSVRDRLLTSASAGLSLSVVIHEVEKGVGELVKAVEEDRATQRLKRLAKHLAEMIEGFSALIRRTGIAQEKASALIRRAVSNVGLRLQVHGIAATIAATRNDFSIKCSARLIVSTIMNLIDNSIYWLDTLPEGQPTKKRIYVGTTNELHGKPAIVIADSGPGFIDPPEYLIEPFVTRKVDGMGLGLHIANEVMKAHKGALEFPAAAELDLPEGTDGAVVALVFNGGHK